MANRLFVSVLLVALIIAAVFGANLTFGPMHHGGGCHLGQFDMTLCASAAEHLTHWQTAFAAVLVNVLLALALAFTFFFFRPKFACAALRHSVAMTARGRHPPRPTLMQELLSSGIIHRKEPRLARDAY